MEKKQVSPVDILLPITPNPPSLKKVMNTTSKFSLPSELIPWYLPILFPV